MSVGFISRLDHARGALLPRLFCNVANTHLRTSPDSSSPAILLAWIRAKIDHAKVANCFCVTAGISAQPSDSGPRKSGIFHERILDEVSPGFLTNNCCVLRPPGASR